MAIFNSKLLNDQRVNHNAMMITMFCGLANIFETNSNPRRGQESDDIIKLIKHIYPYPRMVINPLIDMILIIWLVVWNMTFMTFHILGIIIPTDFHICQMGWSTTNQDMRLIIY